MRSFFMALRPRTFLALFLAAALAACHSAKTEAASGEPVIPTNKAPAILTQVGAAPGHAGKGTPLVATGDDKLAAFAAGCFWGVEDAFRHVPGVVATAPGYAGGHAENPTYEDVCTHTTGHAETVLVEYDPHVITYAKLLSAFWKIHDPTQGDRQGPDFGDSYRSVVFTFGDDQAKVARASLEAEKKNHAQKITTQITTMERFYIAEPFHQQYAERTGDHSCPIKLSMDSL